MPRFLLQNKEIRNKNIVFSEAQSKKIRKVLRMKSGDKVIVFDNQGWEYTVELVKVRNEETMGKIIEQKLHERQTNITLYQALPKNLKVEFIIQKCSELGVDEIIFFESEFSQVKAGLMNDKKLKRWQKVADNACEQSGRLFTSSIQLLQTSTLNDLLIDIPEKDLKSTFILDKSRDYLKNISEFNPKEVRLFVGPEGGFSPTEVKLFGEKSIRKVKLSENILRSETAGMTFLAQLALIS